MRKLTIALAALLIPLMPLAASAHDHDGWHGHGDMHEHGWHGDRDWHHHGGHDGYYAGGVYYPAGYYAPYYASPAPMMVVPQPAYYAPPLVSVGFMLGH